MLQEKHVVIMSLGIGSLISDDELHKIASEPQSKHVFHINSFDDLKSHISEIEASACGDHDLHGKYLALNGTDTDIFVLFEYRNYGAQKLHITA